MSWIKSYMESACQSMKRSLKECELYLKKVPKGYLLAYESKKGNRLYWVHNEKRHGTVVRIQKRLLKSDYSIAKAIRDKRICTLKAKVLKNNLKWANSFLQHYMPYDEESILQHVKEPYRSLPGFENEAAAKHVITASENPYYREHLIYKNSVGELYRSKAEMNISELLLAERIDYRYEKKLELGGKIKYPDFTIKIPGTDKKKIIEYFGMLDKENYGKITIEKINWYMDQGYVPGRDILFLYETSTSGMDLTVIRNQIRRLAEA